MKIENILLKGIKIGIILALFTPLVIGPFGLTFSAFPKAVFFRTVIEIIFILYLLLVLKNSQYLPRISPLFLIIIIFIGFLILTAFTGINSERSFLGDPERTGGIILDIHLFIFFLILISVVKNREDWIKLFKITIVVSAISSLAGILQKTGFWHFYGVELPSRVSGTLSNPDFFAPYIVLSIFLTIFVLIKEKIKKIKIFWLVILVLNLFTLLLSASRGAWIGFILGSLFFIPFLLFYYLKLSLKNKIIFLLIILFFSSLVFSAILEPEQFNLEKNYFFQRFLSIFNFSLGSRGDVWKISLEAFKERPILGWGTESFSFLYDKYFKAEYLKNIDEGIYFDYAHNKVMELLATTGILGTLSYFFIFIFVFYLLFKRKEKINLILAGFLVSYFIQNLFCFSTISIYLLFFLFLGFVDTSFSEPVFKKRIIFLNNYFLKIIIIVFFIILCFMSFYHINLKPTLAASYFPAYIKYEKNNSAIAFSGYKKAINKKTIYNKDLRLIFIERMIGLLENNQVKDGEEDIIKTLSELKISLEKDLELLDRRSVDSFEYLARINQREYLFYKNKESLQDMEKVLERGISFNNQRPEFYRLMGELKILQDNYQDGEYYFQKMYDLFPKNLENRAEFYKQLGFAYFKKGDKIKAVENFNKAFNIEYYYKKFNLKSVIKESVYFAELLMSIYHDLNDIEAAEKVYKKALEIYPEYEKILQSYLETLKIIKLQNI